jgi:hypothetical protein
MFSHTSRETLGNKMELYFHDHSFVPLFIQVRLLQIYALRWTDPFYIGKLPEYASREDQKPQWTCSNFETT